MAMTEELKVSVEGESYTIRTGQEWYLNSRGEDNALGNEGDFVEVVAIAYEKNDKPQSGIFVQRKRGPHPNWDDAEGITPSACGIKLCARNYVQLFTFNRDSEYKGRMVVNRDLVFKKKNLKGGGCRILAPLDKSNVFVEMEEDVSGGSCDGLGKGGHCIPIKREFLTKSENKKKTKAKGGTS